MDRKGRYPPNHRSGLFIRSLSANDPIGFTPRAAAWNLLRTNAFFRRMLSLCQPLMAFPPANWPCEARYISAPDFFSPNLPTLHATLRSCRAAGGWRRARLGHWLFLRGHDDVDVSNHRTSRFSKHGYLDLRHQLSRDVWHLRRLQRVASMFDQIGLAPLRSSHDLPFYRSLLHTVYRPGRTKRSFQSAACRDLGNCCGRRDLKIGISRKAGA